MSFNCIMFVFISVFLCDNYLYQEYRLISPSSQPDWPGNIKPEDEPTCGFDNHLCANDESRTASKIVAGTLGLLLFCASVITLSIYRKWKIEQEIEGLLWKIETNELVGYYGNDVLSSPSKVSKSLNCTLLYVMYFTFTIQFPLSFKFTIL